MPLPNEVKVGFSVYPITVKDKVVVDGKELWGYWRNYPAKGIELLRCDGRQMIAALLHETIHAIDEDMLIGLKERQVVRLANGLTAFLLANGLLDPSVLEQPAEEGAVKLPTGHELKEGEEKERPQDGDEAEAGEHQPAGELPYDPGRFNIYPRFRG